MRRSLSLLKEKKNRFSVDAIVNILKQPTNLKSRLEGASERATFEIENERIILKQLKNEKGTVTSGYLMYPSSTKFPFVTTGVICTTAAITLYYNRKFNNVGKNAESLDDIRNDVDSVINFYNTLVLRPRDVLEFSAPWKAITSTFLHLDSTGSFFLKAGLLGLSGAFLERYYGSANFALMLLAGTFGLNSLGCWFSSHPAFPLETRNSACTFSAMLALAMFSQHALWRHAGVPMLVLALPLTIEIGTRIAGLTKYYSMMDVKQEVVNEARQNDVKESLLAMPLSSRLMQVDGMNRTAIEINSFEFGDPRRFEALDVEVMHSMLLDSALSNVLDISAKNNRTVESLVMQFATDDNEGEKPQKNFTAQVRDAQIEIRKAQSNLYSEIFVAAPPDTSCLPEAVIGLGLILWSFGTGLWNVARSTGKNTAKVTKKTT